MDALELLFFFGAHSSHESTNWQHDAKTNDICIQYFRYINKNDDVPTLECSRRRRKRGWARTSINFFEQWELKNFTACRCIPFRFILHIRYHRCYCRWLCICSEFDSRSSVIFRLHFSSNRPTTHFMKNLFLANIFVGISVWTREISFGRNIAAIKHNLATWQLTKITSERERERKKYWKLKIINSIEFVSFVACRLRSFLLQ